MDHLQKAREYVAKGDEYYAKAADEIVAAMAADSTLSYRQVAETIGKSERWVRDIVSWSTTAERAPTPYSGEEYADKQAERHAKRVLREASPEQLAKIAESLPEKQKANLAKALTPKATGFRAPQAQTSSLLADIEEFRRCVLELVDKAAGNWQDKAPLADEEQLRLASDTWAETIQDFEQLGLRVLKTSTAVGVV